MIQLNSYYSNPENKIGFDKYLTSIKKYEQLDKETEKQLFVEKRYDDIIKANLRFVISVAKQYQNALAGSSLTLEDLIAEGNAGMIEAAYKFDYTKDVKFIFYAVWYIRKNILDYLNKNFRNIRIPISQYNVYRKLTKIREKYDALEENVDIQDLLEEAIKTNKIPKTIDAEYVKNAFENVQFDKSISMKIGSENDMELIDVIENKDNLDTGSIVKRNEYNKFAQSIVNQMDEETRGIFYDVYGIETEPMTKKNISEKYGLSLEQINRKMRIFARDIQRKYKKAYAKLNEVE